MNRTEYMCKLASLLQDVPEEERVAAMQYYNGYFDDAGEENEQQVMKELGDPEQVAAEIRAGLRRHPEDARDEGFRQTEESSGADSFRRDGERQSADGKRQAGDRQSAENGQNRREAGGWQGAGSGQEAYGWQKAGNGQSADGRSDSGDSGYAQYGRQEPEKKKPWTSKWVIGILVVLIILVAAPVGIPVVLGILGVLLGLVAAAFGIFFALVVAAAAIALAGVVAFLAGIAVLIASPAHGLMLMGGGMILAAVGAVATVAAVRLCRIVLPGMFRFVVELCRKPFHRKRGRGR